MGFWTKERPIFEVRIEKTLKNTGSDNRPFFAKESEFKRYYLFGILLVKIKISGDFPDGDSK